MRFHCLGVQHTITSKEYVACAFTQKVLKFCSMMTLRGHTVIHYGHQDSDVECTEHVTVLTREQYNKVYGAHDFRSKLFKFDQDDEAYNEFNQNAIREINARKHPGDWLLAFWGSGHEPICKGAGEGMRVCEPGIGYPYGHFAEYKIFESYAMYHSFTGIPRVAHCVGFDVWSKEAVIPNYFDPNDFEFSEQKDDYFLFLGRIGIAKGVDMAIRMSEHLGKKLIIGGQNAESGLSEVGMWPPPSHVEIVGHMNVEQKKKYMSRAKAVICMSTFSEPFCGVHVEALMCGTPVITSDWGAMTEFNIHGVTGFRCRTLQQMIDAARQLDIISPFTCRTWALENFSLDKVALKYELFFSNANVFGMAPKIKIAIWTETIWAIGRISRAIQKYFQNAQVDLYDWNDGQKNYNLFTHDWKNYDHIITKSDIFKLKDMFGIELPHDILPKLVVISHSPNLTHSYFKEYIEVHEGPVYAGVSHETCDALRSMGILNPHWVPFGADTDIFKNTHKITGPIRRIGCICVKNHSTPEYNMVKRPDIFEDICRRVNAEAVYICNRLDENDTLYTGIDLFISCSEFESGPLGIFEAAACGVPVLTRPVGNAQYIRGIKLYETIDQAVQLIQDWNANPETLRTYRNCITHEVCNNWSMKKCIEEYFEPCVFKKETDLRTLPITSKRDTTLDPPFLYIENTCSKTPWYTHFVHVPKGADALYLGISEWSLAPGNTHGTKGTMKYTIHNKSTVRVYNMLSSHAILVMTDIWKNALKESREPIEKMSTCNVYALYHPIYYQDSTKGGHDGTLLTFSSIPKVNTVAVWLESTWALGRYAKAIKKYLGQVDVYDWGNSDHCHELWIRGKWKQYETIISNTTLLRLKDLYGIETTEDMSRRFLIISFFPVFEGTGYFQETLKNFPKNARYAGASNEICRVMQNIGVSNVTCTPFTADLDVFRPVHIVSGPIKRLGIIGGPSRTHHSDYQKNKGLEMFSEICTKGGYEPVYIHGRTGDNIYTDIDALICCSQYEGAPTGIFEASSLGIPVFTRPVGCAQDVKGISIFDTIDDALKQLSDWNTNIDKLKEYTEKVSEEIRTNWSLETCIMRYLKPLIIK